MAKPNHINLTCKTKNAELSSLLIGSVDVYKVIKFESTPLIYPFY